MKKVMVTVMSLCLVAQALVADVESEYNRKRLVIQYYSGVSGSWDEEGGNIASYSDWRFHQGFIEISEAVFLDIAGYHAESMLAEEFRKTNMLLLVSGIGALTIGGGVAIAGSTGDDINFNTVYVGVLIMGLGAALAIPLRFRGKHWMPLDQAYAIAEDYNRKLLESLKTAE